MAIEFVKKVPVNSAKHHSYQRHIASLAWNERQRSRLAIMLSDDTPAAILLARGEILSQGDILTSADSRHELLIEAAPESILKITADTPHALLRLVYHLANRHVSIMIEPDAIYIEPDSVLVQMVQHLGGCAHTVTRAFTPERGAYYGPSDHHGHRSHDDLAADDHAFGKIGEALSRHAHGQQ